VSEGGAPPDILVEQLSRSFGPIRALRQVDLCVAPGQALALVGPNGAGKTTLVRLLTLALKPSGGRLRLLGLDPRDQARRVLQQLGVVSHQPFVYDDLSARQNLEFFARLYGVERPTERAEALLDELDLAQRADDPVRTFSRGMQQRVSVARALVHDPRIVLLDEPFTGLDPHAARRLRATLARLREQRRTLLLVTHNLAEALELSDRWAMLLRGRIVDEGASATTSRDDLETSYFARLAEPPRQRRPA